jgi:hypothetical protein
MDLFSFTPSAPARPSISVREGPNSDVVLASFAVDDGPERECEGRVAQMLVALVTAGKAGLTTAQFAAGVRCSDSIHKLRHRQGLGIETGRVGHGGNFEGLHAIYRLSSLVRVFEIGRAAEMRTGKSAARARGALVMRPNLRVIDGGLSFQPDTKPSPESAQPRPIADGITLRGEFIRFSPALREKLASLAADARKPGGAA